MTPKQAAKREHWHVKLADGGLSTMPYRTPAAARAVEHEYRDVGFETRGVVKVRTSQPCPCKGEKGGQKPDAGAARNGPAASAEISEQQECAHLNAISGGGIEG